MIRRKGRKHNFAQTAFIWIVLTIALSMIGAGAASWQDGLGIQGVVSTGEIDPVFTSVTAVPQGETFIENNGKAISIIIEDVCPGDIISFEYTVENRGSIPLEFSTKVNNCDFGLVVTNTPEQGILGGNGGSAAGELTVQVEKDGVEELTTYNFYLELFFRQWSGPPR
jgi:hypothetical protein